MNLEKHAAFVRFERAVMNAWRTARIGRTQEGFTTLALRVIADRQIA
jgi:hypothetical protein